MTCTSVCFPRENSFFLSSNWNFYSYNATFVCCIFPLQRSLPTIPHSVLLDTLKTATILPTTPPRLINAHCLSLLLYATCSRTPALKTRLGWGLKHCIRMSLIKKVMAGRDEGESAVTEEE